MTGAMVIPERNPGWIMRKIVYGLLALLVIAAGAFLILGPGYIEGGMNKVVATPLPAVSERARALHPRLAIADMHADTLLWQRNLLDPATRGQVDLPRLEAGHVALQVFSSVTKTPKGQNYKANGADTDNITLLAVAQLQPPRTWNSLLQRSLWHAEKLRRAEAGSEGRLKIGRAHV